MLEIQLIPIDRAGSPGPGCPPLGELAIGVCAATARLYEKVGYVVPWLGYIALLDGRVVGTCSFVGPPASGRVEIAYYTFPEFEGLGIATSMARDLTILAKVTEPDIIVTARTLPHRNASTHVLEKLGFVQTGIGVDEDAGDVWVWELSPEREPYTVD
jgi:[ribosomal protein S5]-alanine N-acetyltransferase